MVKKQSTAAVLQLLARDLLADRHLYTNANGTSCMLLLRDPFYISIPLSALSHVRLQINEYNVPESCMALSVREQFIQISACRQIRELYWHMGECAQLIVSDVVLPGLLQQKNHIELCLTVRPPYNYGLSEENIEYTVAAEMGVTV